MKRTMKYVALDVDRATTSATIRQEGAADLLSGMLARGMREDLARVTLTRKLAALTCDSGKQETTTIQLS